MLLKQRRRSQNLVHIYRSNSAYFLNNCYSLDIVCFHLEEVHTPSSLRVKLVPSLSHNLLHRDLDHLPVHKAECWQQLPWISCWDPGVPEGEREIKGLIQHWSSAVPVVWDISGEALQSARKYAASWAIQLSKCPLWLWRQYIPQSFVLLPTLYQVNHTGTSF